MRPIYRPGIIIVIALLVVIGGVVGSGALGLGAHGQTLAASGNVNWPHWGGNMDNNHYSPLTQVNASNVGKLGLAWTRPEGKKLSIWETQPSVVNGKMYFTTNVDQVLAVNAATGKLLWQYTPRVNFYHAIAGGGGGVPTNRGVQVANGKVYLLTFDDKLTALQASTGEKLWSTSVANSNAGYSETSPPTYWNGMLFVGSAESDAGMRGFVAAYNAKTGKQEWRYYDVPAPGHGWMPKNGHHGGGDVWMPPTVDTTTGKLYFGTGNASPDLIASVRKGCNPHVDSTVALNARTGHFLWARNEVCPDGWDYDSHQSPQLFNLKLNGKTVRAVGQGNKEGHYWIFNAATGKTIAESPEVVPYSKPHKLPTSKGVKVCPGTQGGIEYPGPAYSPKLQSVFQPGENICMIYKSEPVGEANTHRSGNVDIGGTIVPVKPYFGTMTAINAATGKFRWHKKMPAPCLGGSMATASNLVFAGCDNGYLYAFDAKNGKVLWKGHIGLAVGAPPIAYEISGTEYIALATGGSATSTLTGASNLGGTLAVFKLGGRKVTPFKSISAGFVPTKSELPSLRGLTKVSKFMYYSAKQKHVVLKIAAALTPNNNGFNFDGYAKGKANFVVPAGWNVEMEFTNKSRIPHSLAVASNHTNKPKVPDFGIAPQETPNPMVGISAGRTQLIGFSAQPAGRYYLVCLVPGHVESGMWDNFTISKTAKKPMIITH